MQFQRCILHRIEHAKLGQSRPQRAQNYLLGCITRDLEACDQNIVTGAHGQTR